MKRRRSEGSGQCGVSYYAPDSPILSRQLPQNVLNTIEEIGHTRHWLEPQRRRRCECDFVAAADKFNNAFGIDASGFMKLDIDAVYSPLNCRHSAGTAENPQPGVLEKIPDGQRKFA